MSNVKTLGKMFPCCIRRRFLLLVQKMPQYHQNRFKCSAETSDDSSDQTSLLMRLFADRYYISPGVFHSKTCTYGPLGTELKKNIHEQWWTSVVRSRAQVLGINTSLYGGTCEEPVRIVNCGAIQEILNQNSFTKEEATQKIQKLLQDSVPVRTSLLQGALQQYIQALELVNRKLPFGLAEIGWCHRPDEQLRHAPFCSSEVTESLLVWFCSARTSSQWMDFWARQRLQWWRKCRDGRKSVVPHVISISGNMDRGMLAYLFNSLQLLKKTDRNMKLYQRTVLKLHPTLTPVKVALDMGRGSNLELRQVCEGLLQEFLDAGISTWPGYLGTMPSSLEILHTKYDEMGVLFTVMVSESTLKNGLLLIRNRDTTIRETMHISEIKHFLLKYISASDNL
ncbi:DNA polymerase subunit gamma-2, mitochondrial isoform X3 [Myxocyprinus asiaticus]|uniref:DNA polymerase subunit gamma-2, mitochondrial isoform X3 n=1 Tax=Myxocyprinus asiaticus TaxID=70543 RepID=UPI00222219BA|nr:DNA polymerase subunit gamma-2, mitochondrial isoform X3 [Myxocyprinus asiaticus]